MRKAGRGLVHVIVCVLGFGTASAAWAHAIGVTSNEFFPPSAGCNTSSCHGSGTTPTVSLTGPATVSPGSTHVYTFQINNPGVQQKGGLNVSAPLGTLGVDPPEAGDTHTLTNSATTLLELTHSSPKAAVSGVTTFTLQWTAPASFASVTLTAWGNAVNGDGSNSGDRAAMTTLTVFSDAPTFTPTVTATPTETPTVTPTDTPAPSMHDSVVLPVAPRNVIIAKAKTLPTSKFFKVKVHVRNADPVSEVIGDSITLTADRGNCPLGIMVGTPSFGPPLAGNNTIVIPGGKTKTAVVPVTVHDTDFSSFNHKAPNRCTLSFTATTNVPGSTDPTENNTTTVEINIIDKNDPQSTTAPPPHETVLRSLPPLIVNIGKKAPATLIKFVHPVVANADISPAPDTDDITVTVDPVPSTCPWITEGTLDMDAKTDGDQSDVTVKGGKSKAGKLQLLLFANAVTTTNHKSPARCTLTFHATGPSDPDPETSNNTSTLTVDVIDHND